MIRKAYFEDPSYVPLLLRAYDLWREIERETDTKLLRVTGLLMVGGEQTEIIAGARRSAQEHALPLESLTAREIRKRYPTLKILDEEMGVFERDGGVLDPERAVEAQLKMATAAGAQMRFGVAMNAWVAVPGGFAIQLADGTSVTSRALVLSLGPWFKDALECLGVSICVQRNVQAWFRPTTRGIRRAALPAVPSRPGGATRAALRLP